MRSSTALRTAHGQRRWIQVGQHIEERSMRRGFSLDRGQDNEGSGAIVIILRTKSEGRFEKSFLRRVLLHFSFCCVRSFYLRTDSAIRNVVTDGNPEVREKKKRELYG